MPETEKPKSFEASLEFEVVGENLGMPENLRPLTETAIRRFVSLMFTVEDILAYTNSENPISREHLREKHAVLSAAYKRLPPPVQELLTDACVSAISERVRKTSQQPAFSYIHFMYDTQTALLRALAPLSESRLALDAVSVGEICFALSHTLLCQLLPNPNDVYYSGTRKIWD